MSNLERLAEEGFTDTAVEAAINTIEFSLRENNTGSFPRGLSLMLRAMSSWIYDQDPFQPLQWTKELEHFKARTPLQTRLPAEIEAPLEARLGTCSINLDRQSLRRLS